MDHDGNTLRHLIPWMWPSTPISILPHVKAVQKGQYHSIVFLSAFHAQYRSLERVTVRIHDLDLDESD